SSSPAPRRCSRASACTSAPAETTSARPSCRSLANEPSDDAVRANLARPAPRRSTAASCHDAGCERLRGGLTRHSRESTWPHSMNAVRGGHHHWYPPLDSAVPDSGSAFWSALVGGTTAGSLEGEYKRRFLAGLLLALIPLSAVLGIFVLPQWLAPLAPEQTSTFQAAGGFTIGLLLAFVVNRLGYYRTAASLTVLAVLAATFWASFDH